MSDVQYSDDGNWWWDVDAQEWQPVEGAQSSSSSDASYSPSEAGGMSTNPIAVNHSLTLVPQPTDVTCWAASIAMLTGKTVDEVCTEAGMTTTDGYGWPEIQQAVSMLGLTEVGPACGGPDYFAPMLERSPLWIVEVGAPYHAVVLAGLNGGGNWDDTEATIYNPWPPGSGAIERKPFMDFANEYELGAGALAQIVTR